MAPSKREFVLLLSLAAAEIADSEALAWTFKFPNKDPEEGLLWSFCGSVCFCGSWGVLVPKSPDPVGLAVENIDELGNFVFSAAAAGCFWLNKENELFAGAIGISLVFSVALLVNKEEFDSGTGPAAGFENNDWVPKGLIIQFN